MEAGTCVRPCSLSAQGTGSQAQENKLTSAQPPVQSPQPLFGLYAHVACFPLHLVHRTSKLGEGPVPTLKEWYIPERKQPENTTKAAVVCKGGYVLEELGCRENNLGKGLSRVTGLS